MQRPLPHLSVEAALDGLSHEAISINFIFQKKVTKRYENSQLPTTSLYILYNSTKNNHHLYPTLPADIISSQVAVSAKARVAPAVHLTICTQNGKASCTTITNKLCRAHHSRHLSCRVPEKPLWSLGSHSRICIICVSAHVDLPLSIE